MFSPVGNLPPSVYWRRRLFVVGAGILLILLIVLTVSVVAGGGDGQQPLAGEPTQSATPSTTGAASTPTGSTPAASSPSSSTASSPATSGPATSRPGGVVPPASSMPPVRCAASNLGVQAVVGQTKYEVGQRPVVSMQVTNTGSRPCVQDLADKQIVLRLYNGQSRVWGSHDCEIQPGTTDRTLPMNQPVRVSITWSGSTSQEGCKGPRQRVGAGTYTLYASLAGKSGKAASFTIT